MDVCNNVSAAAPQSFPAPPAPRRRRSLLGIVRADVDEMVRFRPAIQNMVVQELRVRYQRSFLGFLWTLINPILMMGVLTVVFSTIFPTKENYTLYLLAGMVPWGLMAGSISEAAVCIIQNEALIRKIYVPKMVFPLVRVLINLTTMVLSLVSLFVLMIPLGARPSWPMLLLPAAIALFTVFSLGLSLMIATANTFFRDLGHLVGVVIQAWYFATPIIYSLDEPKFEAVRWRFQLNPAYYFIEIFHNLISDGTWPAVYLWVVASTLAFVSLGIGYAAFKSNEDKMVFRL